MQGAGIDPEIGQFADERVGRRFPNIHGQRPGIQRSQLLFAFLALGRDRWYILGGGHQVNNGIQQRQNAFFMPAGGCKDQDIGLGAQNGLKAAH